MAQHLTFTVCAVEQGGRQMVVRSESNDGGKVNVYAPGGFEKSGVPIPNDSTAGGVVDSVSEELKSRGVNASSLPIKIGDRKAKRNSPVEDGDQVFLG